MNLIVPIFIFFIFSILMNSCTTNQDQSSNVAKTKIDTLVIIHKDTVVITNTKIDTIIAKTATATHIIEKKINNTKDTMRIVKTTELKTTTPTKQKYNEEKITYYTGTKDISTKTEAWKDGKRTIYLYGPNTKVSYTFNDVNHSYSNVTDLKFRTNGSVAEAITNSNPGASMYWYSIITRFDDSNIPMNRETIKHPTENLEEYMNRKIELWDSRKNAWVKQETME